MKITRAPRRGKPTSFLCRIRQPVPHAESDVAWSGSYSADPLITGRDSLWRLRPDDPAGPVRGSDS